MQKANKGKEPPQFMRTPPSSTNRINKITEWINQDTLEYPPLAKNYMVNRGLKPKKFEYIPNGIVEKDWELIIPPDNTQIKKLQGLGKDLIWTGPLSDKELCDAYRNCTFTVYPSLYEGFGIPVLESLSFGKPCICSNRGALLESAKGGGCLILKDPDAKNIAEAMSRLLNDKNLLMKL